MGSILPVQDSLEGKRWRRVGCPVLSTCYLVFDGLCIDEQPSLAISPKMELKPVHHMTIRRDLFLRIHQESSLSYQHNISAGSSRAMVLRVTNGCTADPASHLDCEEKDGQGLAGEVCTICCSLACSNDCQCDGKAQRVTPMRVLQSFGMGGRSFT